MAKIDPAGKDKSGAYVFGVLAAIRNALGNPPC
jgi:hypothetical protein